MKNCMKNILSKKIGIMTFHNVDNYGAQLQAFALQSKCSEYCNNVEIINYIEQSKNDKSINNKYYNYFCVLLENKFKLRTFFRTKNARALTKSKFKEFRENKLNITRERYYDFDDLERMEKNYDAFVCGSDMVWTDIGQDLNAYFLKFTDTSKRLSYAPSLTGTAKLSQNDDKIMKENIDGMRFLSCREQEGVNYIKKICNKDAFLALDPTLLYDKADWKKLLNIKEQKDKNYILCYMFKGVPKSVKKRIKKIALKENLDIRYIPMNIEEYSEEIKNGKIGGYGPKEFVELFLNATFIITNSFHGLLFSLIAEKPFIVYYRESGNKWSLNEERMANILRLTKQENRFINLEDDICEKFLLNKNQTEINEIIRNKRQESIEFLKKSLMAVEKNDDNEINILGDNIELVSKKICTGCSTCTGVCPFDAISMKENEEGFLYPMIDKQKCKKCKKCKMSCPVVKRLENNVIKECYYGYSKDLERIKSASGGVFYTIAKFFLKEDDAYVYGATLDNDGICRHICVKKIEDLYKLQNSKYVQSDIGDCFVNIKKYLDNGKKILFSGTPCQIDGLKKYLNKDYSDLFTIDIVCHGVPSPKFLKKYLEAEKIKIKNDNKYLDKENNVEITFRNKDNQTKQRSVYEFKFEKLNKVKRIPASTDVYYSAFLKNDSYRMSCYYCKYANTNRVGDITIGDCDSWREQERFNDEEAKSIILINSNKGCELWKQINKLFEFRKLNIDIEIAINGPLREPSSKTLKRAEIYEDLNNLSWKEFNKKYKPKNSLVFIKKIIIKAIKAINK